MMGNAVYQELSETLNANFISRSTNHGLHSFDVTAAGSQSGVPTIVENAR